MRRGRPALVGSGESTSQELDLTASAGDLAPDCCGNRASRVGRQCLVRPATLVCKLLT